MVYVVQAARGQVNAHFTVTGLIQALSTANPPATLTFPYLGNPPNTNSLGTGAGRAIAFSANTEVTRAFGLITCASICFVSSASTIGYVYHANAGVIAQGAFLNAIAAIGATGNLGSVYIAYARNGATDPGNGYRDSINDMVNWGVPTNNIVQITDLQLGNFGMNNMFQLGY